MLFVTAGNFVGKRWQENRKVVVTIPRDTMEHFKDHRLSCNSHKLQTQKEDLTIHLMQVHSPPPPIFFFPSFKNPILSFDAVFSS